MSTTATAHCFAHRHLTFAEYGLYSHLREVSSKQKFQYRFDDRTLAGRFAPERGSSKDTCNRLRNALVRKGFVEWLEPQQREGGRFAPRLGRILSHQEHAAKYPDSCRTCSASATGASITDATGTSLKLGIHQSQQRDIIGIETQQEKSRSGIAAAPPPPLPSSVETVEKPLGQSNAPVSAAIQVKSEAVSSAVTADCIRRLAEIAKRHVLVSQTTDDLPNMDLLAKLTTAQAEAILEAAFADPFWDTKLSGTTALRTFCKHLPTIAKQQLAAQRRQKSLLKAASVVPNAARPFQYAGETL